ncbi:hypothetical protein EYF80_011871 [Liparis tanakae]|uniref:Uncharacterized protein n=1 Tax=Liparis tanakae TaxID=230148 RepID=A0A4Z2IJE3_9TELE|nr:hypothetical protein EYF80_011871 [Liparis tanakae]
MFRQEDVKRSPSSSPAESSVQNQTEHLHSLSDADVVFCIKVLRGVIITDYSPWWSWYKHDASCCLVSIKKTESATLRLHLGTVDDDEGGTGRLLTRLAHGALLGQLGEHSWRVEVVDAGLEETGSQGQTQHLLRLQLQLVLGLTHPGTYLLLLCLKSMSTSTGAEEQLDRVRVTGTTQRLDTQKHNFMELHQHTPPGAKLQPCTGRVSPLLDKRCIILLLHIRSTFQMTMMLRSSSLHFLMMLLMSDTGLLVLDDILDDVTSTRGDSEGGQPRKKKSPQGVAELMIYRKIHKCSRLNIQKSQKEKDKLKMKPTFVIGRVDTLVEAPVLTAAGHLDDVELTHATFTLGAQRRKIKTTSAQ